MKSTAQPDSLKPLPDFYQDQIESYIENQESDMDFDFDALGDQLRLFARNPLPLNTCTRTDLESLGLLTDLQVTEFFRYLETLEGLKSIYELQAIPTIDLRTIDRILPFVTIEEKRNLTPRSLLKMLAQGDNNLFLRSTSILQTQAGYHSANGSQRKYSGPPHQFYVRFKHTFERKVSYGFTLENDAGEPFFTGVNRFRLDYQSYHLFIREYNQVLKAIAIGDYAVSLGQGLLMHSGYGGGKGSLVTMIKRGGPALRPYTSVDENSLLRGVATTFELAPLTATLFTSMTRRDANIESDSLGTQLFTSLQSSGLHRTSTEIEDKDAIRHLLFGASTKYQKRNLSISINGISNRFSNQYSRNIQPYNQYYFRGQRLENWSMGYNYILKNFNFFGETARSSNGGAATINGLMVGLSRYVDLAISYRNISKDYQALQASAFIESSQVNNEKGLYLGAEIKLNPSFWVSLYFDSWKHPWLKFRVDAPSIGKEQFIRFTYYKKRQTQAYIQLKSEIKARNFRPQTLKNNQLVSRNKKNIRLHLNHKIHPNLELRSRIETSMISATKDVKASHGILIFQDFIFKSKKSPLSFTSRFSYFDTDDFDSRIYAYENDILYSFSIPSFSDQGIRYYLNLRYRLRNITLEARYEKTKYRYRTKIGSGNDTIEGNVKSRIKMQCRIAF